MAFSANYPKQFAYTSHDVSARYEGPPRVEGTIHVTLGEFYARSLYRALNSSEALKIPELTQIRTALGGTIPFQVRYEA